MLTKFIITILLLHSGNCIADVIIYGTRVIYESGDKSVNFNLKNIGANPALVQTWLDSGDSTSSPEKADSPFMLITPLVRMESDTKQTMELIYFGKGENKNQESLLWINILEIPTKYEKSKNFIQFSIRKRIKLFYRPSELIHDEKKVVDNITFTNNSHGILLENSNALFLSIPLLSIKNSSGNLIEQYSNLTIPPYSDQTFIIKKGKARLSKFSLVNDLGKINSYTSLIDN